MPDLVQPDDVLFQGQDYTFHFTVNDWAFSWNDANAANSLAADSDLAGVSVKSQASGLVAAYGFNMQVHFTFQGPDALNTASDVAQNIAQILGGALTSLSFQNATTGDSTIAPTGAAGVTGRASSSNPTENAASLDTLISSVSSAGKWVIIGLALVLGIYVISTVREVA